MKQIGALLLALVATTSCVLHPPRDSSLEEHLVGEWVLARPPEDFMLTSQTDTVLYPDGTWDQHYRDYLMFCATSDVEADQYYQEHPEEHLLELERQRQRRLSRQWKVQGKALLLYESADGAEKLVEQYVIRQYGHGSSELCGENCPEGKGPFSFIVVASRGEAPRTLWVRLPISQ